MGSGASITEDQKVALSTVLKDEYENLKAANKSDEEITAILTVKYNEINGATKQSAAPASVSTALVPVTAPTSSGTVTPAKAPDQPRRMSGKRESQKESQKPNRRKSFGDQIVVNKPSVAAASPSPEKMLSSASAVTLPSTEQIISDCWDSVSEQPFCSICQMGFKTLAFLERHTKYSDLHIKNAKAKEEKASLALESPIKSQQEGTHFRLIYSGTKIFWRTQDTVDLDIYYHIVADTMEVIAFNLTKNKEISRTYLNNAKLVALTEAEMTKQMTKESVFEDVLRRVITSAIISRMQLSGGVVNYVLGSLDDSASSPLLPSFPSSLVPVAVMRRRRTNSDEIESTMKNLAKDHAELTAATARAERVGNCVFQTAIHFTATKNRFSTYSTARRRWIFAAKRVINKMRKGQMLAYLAKVNFTNFTVKKPSPATTTTTPA